MRRLLPLLCLLIAFKAAAQDGICPAIVQTALQTLGSVCADTGRNQACYGNFTLTAQPQPGIADFHFSQPGDIADVAGVKSLRLSGMDTAANTWGVALMKIQANIPDTLPGQNVTFLLFGDVEITNTAPVAAAPVTFRAVANTAVIVYNAPNTNGAIVAGVVINQQMMVEARTADNLWLLIQLPNDPTHTGWIEASKVTPAGDVSTLDIADSEPQHLPVFAPMQAFFVQTSAFETACREVPPSGILIQAPADMGPIHLSINGADVRLGSTAYIQAQPSGEMTISMIEGAGLIEVNGEVRALPAGTRVRIPVDADLAASGIPGATEPYNVADIRTLPLSVLPLLVEVVPPLTPTQIAALNIPLAGEWIRHGITSQVCPTFSQVTVEDQTMIISNVTDQGFTITNPDSANPEEDAVHFVRGALDFQYVADWSNRDNWLTATYDYKVISPSHILGTATATNQDGCAYTIERELVLIRAN